MEFKDLQEAKEYIHKIEGEKAELQNQLDNQKTVIEDNKKTIEEYKKDNDRLKIKNYEIFEQLTNQNNTNNTSNSNKTNNNNNNSNNNSLSINDLINKLM